MHNGGSLEFPVVQQCGNEDNKAGTGVMNQCACGRIQQFQKRQYDGCGIDAHDKVILSLMVATVALDSRLR